MKKILIPILCMAVIALCSCSQNTVNQTDNNQEDASEPGKCNISAQTKSQLDALDNPTDVARTFVESIINKKYSDAFYLLTDKFRTEIYSEVNNNESELIETLEQGHDIIGMRPLLKMGYHLVITEERSTDLNDVYAMYGETNPYDSADGRSISFDCADQNDELYSGYDYDSNTRILLVQENGKWRIFMWK